MSDDNGRPTGEGRASESSLWRSPQIPAFFGFHLELEHAADEFKLFLSFLPFPQAQGVPHREILLSAPRAAFQDDAHADRWAAMIFESMLRQIEPLGSSMLMKWLETESALLFRSAAAYSLHHMGVSKYDDLHAALNEHEKQTHVNLQGLLGLPHASNKTSVDTESFARILREGMASLPAVPDYKPRRGRPRWALAALWDKVNEYLLSNYPAYASNSGDALRKKCANLGIDFKALWAEEQQARNLEN